MILVKNFSLYKKKSMAQRCSLSNVHSLGDHLAEIDSNEIIIIQNLGAQINREVNEQNFLFANLSVFLFSVSIVNMVRINYLLLCMKKKIIKKKMSII
jgi:hypothetical protein